MPTYFTLEEFVPSLRLEYDKKPLNLKNFLRVGIPVRSAQTGGKPIPVLADRHELIISDGEKDFKWKAESLTSMFRGNKKPPGLSDPPEAYNLLFAILELNLLEICAVFGEPRDAEMKEVYSILRRRPDGRSLGFVHDYMWQLAALLLGTHCLSQAEFEAIVSRLERSCRTFEQGPTSRNYIAALRMTIGKR
jgi:hypothetical protein